MTARDPQTIAIAGNGDVNFAPIGTTLPTGPDDALDAAFKPMGYITEEGVTFSPNLTSEGIAAWQSLAPVRTVITEQDVQMAFELMEWREDSIVAFFGGGTFTDNLDGTWTFDMPTPDEITEFAMVIDALDGTSKYRLVFERVQVAETGDVTFVRSDAAGLPCTYRALANAAGRPGVIYGQSPAVTAP